MANLQQRRGEALKVNISAGEGLQDVLKSNLGPLGTIKMSVYILRNFTSSLSANNLSRLVDGAGQVRTFPPGPTQFSPHETRARADMLT